MQIKFENVKLVYTHQLSSPNPFGSYSYSFIVNKHEFLNIALSVIKGSKKVKIDNPTPAQIIKISSAKTREETPDNIKVQMGVDDLLVSVTSKQGSIRYTPKNKQLTWFSVCDILVDMYLTEYQKRKFLCRTTNHDIISIKVKEFAASASVQPEAKGFEEVGEEEQDYSGFEEAPF